MKDFRQRPDAGVSPLDPFGGLTAARTPGIRRLPMHVQVTNRLRDLIVDGRLRPGERINENDLAEFLNVSRTPLREALKELQSEGLIDHEPNKGSRVSYITAEHTAELFESLACIEGFCAESATHKIGESQLHQLEALHEEMFTLRESGARSAYFDLNERIHRTFVKLAGNSLLINLHARLMVGARRVRFTAIRFEERWDKSVAEHRTILAAMKERDGPTVRRTIEAHVEDTGECVCSHLRELDMEPPPRPRRPRAYDHRLRY